MREHVNPVEGRRSSRRGKEAQWPLVGKGDDLVRRRDQPIRPVGHAPAVSQFEVGKSEAQAPGRRPLDPRFDEAAGDSLDVVLLRKSVMNGPYHEAQLQGGRLRERPEGDLAT